MDLKNRTKFDQTLRTIALKAKYTYDDGGDAIEYEFETEHVCGQNIGVIVPNEFTNSEDAARCLLFLELVRIFSEQYHRLKQD